MSLALFTSLKPSSGMAGEIQNRALQNWHTVFAHCNIVKFEGPLVPFREMAAKVKRETDAELLMYANGDLLFEDGNVLVHDRGDAEFLEDGKGFLLTGQRIDILEDGSKRLHRPSGMDYFVFRRGMFHDLPDVLMGRAYCDCALVAYCLRKGIPVIDASYALRVEHQFHDYDHVAGGRTSVWRGEEALANKRSNNLRDFGPNVLDATHTLLPDGRIVPNVRKRPGYWRLWNLLTRGGKWWKNPKWPGVKPI